MLLKGHYNIWWHFNFESLIYMKIYSLLILTKDTYKIINKFKAIKKTKLGTFIFNSYIAM